MSEQVELHVFDPASLSRLHHLFHSCWDEVRTDISSSLGAESESSLRQTIAARIFAEAGRGVVDPQELRRKALFGVCNKLA
jgi:hypothetical protein